MVKRNKPVRPPREGIVSGVAHAFCETGTEGIIWSVQDEKHMGEDGRHWSYEGLNCLDKGDFLRVFNDAARTEVAWEGEIKLKYPPSTRYNRGIQRGVNEEIWARMFFDEKPATVILADTWKKMKADNRTAERERQKTMQEIDQACYDGVPVKPLKQIKIKRSGPRA